MSNRKVEQQLLSAFESDDRNDHIATPGDRRLDLGLEQGSALLDRDWLADAGATGALADQMIDAQAYFGIGWNALLMGLIPAGAEADSCRGFARG